MLGAALIVSSGGSAFLIGVLLILVGLAIVWMSPSAGGLLSVVARWIGVVLAFIGVVLVITPVLVWVYAQLRAMFDI